MSRIMTFSERYPAYHPRAGTYTFFIGKIYASIGIVGKHTGAGLFEPKGHTVRAGHRWKVGDTFSPRAWIGKPYNSKCVAFSNDITVVSVWKFEIKGGIFYLDDENISPDKVLEIATNDGLSLPDFLHWFKYDSPKGPKDFSGQIICWDTRIKY